MLLAAVTIRKYDPRDLERIVAIERQAFGRFAWPGRYFVEIADACPKLFLAAETGGRIAAYSITCVRGDRAELVSLAVGSRYRRRGFAKLLLRHTLSRLRRLKVRLFWLTVRRDNDSAIRLYREFGFIRTRTVPRYYEDGASGWRMRRES